MTSSSLINPTDIMPPQAAVPNAKAAPKNLAAIKKTAQEFESVYLNEMLGQMFKGVSTTGLMGGGNSEEIFRSLMVQQYSNSISKTGSLGISNAVMQEMIKLQEKAH